MEPITTTAMIATAVASGATNIIKDLFSKHAGKTIDSAFEAEFTKKIENVKGDVEARVQVLLIEERTKYKLFEKQLERRNDLYENVWQMVDPVSQEQWRWEGDPKKWIIDQVSVSTLLKSLIELNRESGFLFDPTSRGFLLDLRQICKRCATEYDINLKAIRWTYDDHPDPSYPHGIKLWMAKSALRRSMVRALQSPIFGEPQYFNRDQQKKIREEVKENVTEDFKRGNFPESEIAKTIVTNWVGLK